MVVAEPLNKLGGGEFPPTNGPIMIRTQIQQESPQLTQRSLLEHPDQIKNSVPLGPMGLLT